MFSFRPNSFQEKSDIGRVHISYRSMSVIVYYPTTLPSARETKISFKLLKIEIDFIANEQDLEDARLRGSSVIKPCAKVPRRNEFRGDVT